MRAIATVTTQEGLACSCELSGDQTTIGSRDAAGLKVQGVPWLLPEHVLLAPRGDQCWVSIAAAGPPAQVSEKYFQSGYLPWGSSIFLGGVRIDLERRSEASNLSARGPDTQQKTNPALLAALVVGLSWFGFMIYSKRADSASMSTLSETPALFDEELACGDGDSEHLAWIESDTADAKRVRYVFVAQDGVAAVHHYKRASACFDSAGDGANAAGMRQAADRLSQRIEADLQRSILGFERAMQRDDKSGARIDCDRILAILAHRDQTDFYMELRRLSLVLASAEDEED